ncbi:hypothetical protein NEHOM01_0466 [Nematocida homosporus]|uniref:uncharacterized protein n=1 Tax=Nematocida homosporus TaxID=1912981 RepID=UPI00222001F4|nr:uncharacterized protein NEHOM01_0466 [Nematocida homosporus]KAI5184915.1 hypothetical protein NEHOM01_0466 [Nematocida homosporus]
MRFLLDEDDGQSVVRSLGRRPFLRFSPPNLQADEANAFSTQNPASLLALSTAKAMGTLMQELLAAETNEEGTLPELLIYSLRPNPHSTNPKIYSIEIHNHAVEFSFDYTIESSPVCDLLASLSKQFGYVYINQLNIPNWRLTESSDAIRALTTIMPLIRARSIYIVETVPDRSKPVTADLNLLFQQMQTTYSIRDFPGPDHKGHTIVARVHTSATISLISIIARCALTKSVVIHFQYNLGLKSAFNLLGPGPESTSEPELNPELNPYPELNPMPPHPYDLDEIIDNPIVPQTWMEIHDASNIDSPPKSRSRTSSQTFSLSFKIDASVQALWDYYTQNNLEQFAPVTSSTLNNLKPLFRERNELVTFRCDPETAKALTPQFLDKFVDLVFDIYKNELLIHMIRLEGFTGEVDQSVILDAMHASRLNTRKENNSILAQDIEHCTNINGRVDYLFQIQKFLKRIIEIRINNCSGSFLAWFLHKTYRLCDIVYLVLTLSESTCCMNRFITKLNLAKDRALVYSISVYQVVEASLKSGTPNPYWLESDLTNDRPTEQTEQEDPPCPVCQDIFERPSQIAPTFGQHRMGPVYTPHSDTPMVGSATSIRVYQLPHNIDYETLCQLLEEGQNDWEAQPKNTNNQHWFCHSVTFQLYQKPHKDVVKLIYQLTKTIMLIHPCVEYIKFKPLLVTPEIAARLKSNTDKYSLSFLRYLNQNMIVELNMIDITTMKDETYAIVSGIPEYAVTLYRCFRPNSTIDHRPSTSAQHPPIPTNQNTSSPSEGNPVPMATES